MIDVADHADFAALGLALAGQHFDQLPLAVAGNAGDADDLAAANAERHIVHRDRAGIVERVEFVQLQPRRADFADARRLHRQFFRADHHARHAVRRKLGDLAGAGELSAPQDGHLVGERHHLAKLVRDHQDGEAGIDHHVAQHAQHFVGFAGREHRGRLVENEKTPLQIKLLEDFALLPLAGGNVGDPRVERHLERHPRKERFQLLLFLGPVHDGRNVVARQHQVFGDRHRRHQRKMLIHHAKPERVGILRIGDRLLAAADQHVAFGRVVVAHDAFHQRAFAGAVFAEQRMERAGPHFQFDIVEGDEIAEAHGHGDGVDAERAFRHRAFRR